MSEKRWRRSFHVHHRKNPSDEVSILNIYAPITGAPSSVKETLLKFKSHIKFQTIIVEDFNTPHSPLDRSARQKNNREKKDLADVMTQMVLTDIYRTLHPNTKEYIFFLAPHRFFSQINHILSNKTSLNRSQKTGITLCVISDHHGLKLDSTTLF